MIKTLRIQDRSEDKCTGTEPGNVIKLLQPTAHVIERIAKFNGPNGLSPVEVAAALMKGQRVYTNFHSYALVEAAQ